MNRIMPPLPVRHQLQESTQIHVHRVGDAIQLSHPLSSPSPPAPNPSQHQGLFQWELFTRGGLSIGVSASASVLPMNTQDWSTLGWTAWIYLQSKGLSRVFSNTGNSQKHWSGVPTGKSPGNVSTPWVRFQIAVRGSLVSNTKLQTDNNNCMQVCSPTFCQQCCLFHLMCQDFSDSRELADFQGSRIPWLIFFSYLECTRLPSYSLGTGM